MAVRRNTTSALLRPACSQPPLAPHPLPAVSPAMLRRFSVLKKVNKWDSDWRSNRAGQGLRFRSASGHLAFPGFATFESWGKTEVPLSKLGKLRENWGATSHTWKLGETEMPLSKFEKMGGSWGAAFQTWQIKGKLGCHFANLKIGGNWEMPLSKFEKLGGNWGAAFQTWQIKGKLGCHFANLKIGGNWDATFQIWKVGGKLRCRFPNLAN